MDELIVSRLEEVIAKNNIMLFEMTLKRMEQVMEDKKKMSFFLVPRRYENETPESLLTRMMKLNRSLLLSVLISKPWFAFDSILEIYRDGDGDKEPFKVSFIESAVAHSHAARNLATLEMILEKIGSTRISKFLNDHTLATAAATCDVSWVKCLTKYGATCSGMSGFNALLIGLRLNQPEIVTHILENGAELKIKDRFRRTIFHHLLDLKDEMGMKMMDQSFSSLDFQFQHSLLSYAAFTGNSNIVIALAKHWKPDDQARFLLLNGASQVLLFKNCENAKQSWSLASQLYSEQPSSSPARLGNLGNIQGMESYMGQAIVFIDLWMRDLLPRELALFSKKITNFIEMQFEERKFDNLINLTKKRIGTASEDGNFELETHLWNELAALMLNIVDTKTKIIKKEFDEVWRVFYVSFYDNFRKMWGKDSLVRNSVGVISRLCLMKKLDSSLDIDDIVDGVHTLLFDCYREKFDQFFDDFRNDFKMTPHLTWEKLRNGNFDIIGAVANKKIC